MTRTLALLALLLLTIAQAHAADTQYIDCRYPNPDSRDHVVVSLTSPTAGTFFYTTGIDDEGDDQSTGRIGLAKVEDPKADPKKEIVHFLAKWMTVQDGSKITVEFHYSMPKNLIMKPSNSFKAGLTTSILDLNAKKTPLNLNSDDELDCSSRIYSK